MPAAKSVSLIDSSLKQGWTAFKKQPGSVVGAFLLGILMSSAQNILMSLFEHPEGLFGLVITFVGTVISLLASLGMLAIALDFADNKKLSIDNYIKHIDKILPFFLSSLLYGLIVVIGFVALILPGIYLGVRLHFYSYLVLEKGLGPVEALRSSWKLTEGRFWDLLGLWFVSFLLNIAGLLALVIGVVVTAPITAIASAKAYRILGGKKSK